MAAHRGNTKSKQESSNGVGKVVKVPRGMLPKHFNQLTSNNALPWKKVNIGDKLKFSDMTHFLELEELDANDFEAAIQTKNLDETDGMEEDTNDILESIAVDDFDSIEASTMNNENQAKKKRNRKRKSKDSKTSITTDVPATPANDTDNDDDDDDDEHAPEETFDLSASERQQLPRRRGGLIPPPPSDEVDMSAWNEYDLHPLLLQGLQSLKFTQPTAIQVATLPEALYHNRDIVGSAETGSGKTLAFGLPLLHRLLTEPRDSQKKLQALIMTPTRELSIQVADHLKQVAKYTDIAIVPIVGGVSEQKQLRLLSYRPEIVVATPGRLWELLSEAQSDHLNDLQDVRLLVLDEADRMIEAGHYKELDLIFDALHRAGSNVVSDFDVGLDGTLAEQPTDLETPEEGEEEEDEDADEDEDIDEDEEASDQEGDDEDDDENDEDKNTRGKFIKRPKLIERKFMEAKNYLEGDDKNVSSKNRQTFIFSATMSLSDSFRKKLKNGNAMNKKKRSQDVLTTLLQRIAFRKPGPKIINVDAPAILVPTLTEARIFCMADDKDLYLYYFIMRYPGKTVVFVNSIQSGKRLIGLLQLLQLPAFPLHAQMEQRQRLKNLERFTSMSTVVLVATDVAARGLDVPAVDHVIHYHLPRTSEIYVHRSGRTARASRDGLSVLLVAPEELDNYKKICKMLNKQDGIKDFPIDVSFLPELRKRLSLAIKIDKQDHSAKKTNASISWLSKQAKAMDIILDDELSNAQAEDASEVKATKKRVNALRAELKQLLSESVLPKTASVKMLRQAPVTANMSDAFLHNQQPAGDSATTLTGSRNESAIQTAKRKAHSRPTQKKRRKL